MSPWRRAPGLLLRRPVVFVAVALASAVLAIAAASGVLFLSTVGSAALHTQAAADCPEAGLPGATAVVEPRDLNRTRAAGQARFHAAALPAPYSVSVAVTQVLGARAELLSRAGALDNVVELTAATPAGRAGAGVWIPNDLAARGHLRVGSRLRLPTGATVGVAGIYRSLAPDPFSLSNLPRYWCTWHDLIVPAVVESPTGPVLIADDATLARAAGTPVRLSWYAPVVVDATSLPAMRTLAWRGQQAVDGLRGDGIPAEIDPGLGAHLAAARAAQNGLGGAVLPLDLAGVLVAGLLVAGAGVYWATYRAGEIRLLVSRGVGPSGLALKAVLETGPPALVGLVGGYGAALVLVRGVGGVPGFGKLGPSSVLGPGAALQALAAAAAAALAGLLLVALIGARTARSPRRPAAYWPRLPWELAVVVGAVAVGIGVRGAPAARLDHGVVRISPATFVFPLLGAVAVLALLARVVRIVLPRLARLNRRGIAGFLAVHRLAGSPAVTVGLLVAIALPCALLTYAGAITGALSSDIAAKYRTNVGADHVVEVTGPLTRTPRVDGYATVIAQIETNPVLPDGTQVRILGVDPGRFAAFAHTDARQRAQIAQLPVSSARGNVPALLVNGAGVNASSVQIGNSTLRLDVRFRDAIFPGLRDRYRPLLVMDRRALGHLDAGIDVVTQIWTTNAQYPAALRALAGDKEYSILVELTGTVIVGNTGLLPVTWTFGYLRALAALIGLVAVVGLVFALAARTRRRAVSYVLSRRMGLSASAHLRSLLIELSLVVGAGWALGAVVGLGSAAFITPQLDVYPTLLPPPSLAVPGGVLGGTAAVVVGVVVLAALATHRLAQRTRAGEILRLS